MHHGTKKTELGALMVRTECFHESAANGWPWHRLVKVSLQSPIHGILIRRASVVFHSDETRRTARHLLWAAEHS